MMHHRRKFCTVCLGRPISRRVRGIARVSRLAFGLVLPVRSEGLVGLTAPEAVARECD